MTGSSGSLFGRLESMIWQATGLTGARALLLRLVRTVLILGRDVALGQLTLRAMSLVYTTLLSIVPLLALSFSVLKAFGVTNQIRPLLLNLLEPLGEKGQEVALRITGFIENMNVGVLGAVGLVLLIYTAISLIHKIEESLNYIWHTPRPRPFGERLEPLPDGVAGRPDSGVFGAGRHRHGHEHRHRARFDGGRRARSADAGDGSSGARTC